MNLVIAVFSLAGLVFLFLAAFGINFPYLSSGWFGLALIFATTILPGLGLTGLNFLLVVIALLLVIILIVLLKRRQPPPA